MTAPADRSVLARVRGRVQGVSFRQGTVVEARRLGLVGWVRNRRDGSVELLARGAPEDVDALLLWVRSGGPPLGRVDAVEVVDEAGREPARGFEVRPTA